VTLVAILFGSALTMKVQYYMLDEGFWPSLRQSLADLRLAPRTLGS
ncbi:MAG: YeeE/YedE family protein, partial [Acidiferrobacteraceae bacterium]|nr:YeeE/YedE family protein [Acidiferrobacteraceae bacterium]